MNIRALRRNPRFRKTANRLILPLAVIAAFCSTLDSFPAPGKAWRPVLIAQIAATWLAVAISAAASYRNNRKTAALPLVEHREPQL